MDRRPESPATRQAPGPGADDDEQADISGGPFCVAHGGGNAGSPQELGQQAHAPERHDDPQPEGSGAADGHERKETAGGDGRGQGDAERRAAKRSHELGMIEAEHREREVPDRDEQNRHDEVLDAEPYRQEALQLIGQLIDVERDKYDQHHGERADRIEDAGSLRGGASDGASRSNRLPGNDEFLTGGM